MMYDDVVSITIDDDDDNVDDDNVVDDDNNVEDDDYTDDNDNSDNNHDQHTYLSAMNIS